MSEVPFSPNSAFILVEAKKYAIQCNSNIITSIHFVYALCITESRSLYWIAKKSFPNDNNPTLTLKNNIITWLKLREKLEDKIKVNNNDNEIKFSETMKDIINIAKQIGKQPVHDGDYIYENGLIASEFLLAALLIEGTSSGALAITQFSNGYVNSYSLLKEINVNPDNILMPNRSHKSWNIYTLEGVKYTESFWYIEEQLCDITIPKPPTKFSNWIIPHRLLIGEHPDISSVKQIIKQEINTFVSLIGEYTFDTYTTKKYPSFNYKSDNEIIFIHYPIRDFGIPNIEGFISFIKELKRRLLNGYRLYIHCRGGHGRTGTVIIPLLCSLYNIDIEQAQNYILYSTRTTRKSDKYYADYIHMPETNEQMNIIKSILPIISETQ